jgi:hypothetical protein
MPLNEKFEALYCRTGNYRLFHFFHLRHRLPGSAARIITQNFASCRLASSFIVVFFLVFISSPPFFVIGLGQNGLRHTHSFSPSTGSLQLEKILFLPVKRGNRKMVLPYYRRFRVW